MNVNELLDTIEDLLEESTGMPLSGGKRIVDVEQIRDYLDDIRANLPVELRQAQSIVSDRAQLIESANAQAQAIVKKAEERARIPAACVGDRLRRPDRGPHRPPDRDGLLRQYAENHRGDHGRERRTGEKCPCEPAPDAPPRRIRGLPSPCESK